MHEAQEGRKTAQGELDDLLMVFGDLEDKVARYKVGASHWLLAVSRHFFTDTSCFQHRLVALGETVSDGEDDVD